ncbi:NAD(P)-dependent oxidoreductase [Roseicyclus mahoneyensis]|nr:NAD(P)-dependent oxidoreductase [Roseicyclus mahoneyensis]
MTGIAIAGTGRMGTAYAKRLIECGHAVTVWNRTADRTKAAAETGASVAADVAALAGCDVILVSLTDAAAVGAVVDALIAAGIAGKLVVDLSTLLPEETRAMAARVTAAGADFVDCPVGGTVAPALKGQLLGMAGGSDAAFARAKPVLDQLCKRVEHMGPAGNGAAMKLAVNLPLAVYWSTLAEALAMVAGAGIPADLAVSLLADSSGGPNVLKNRAQVVIDTLNGTDQPGTFDIAGLAKDLALALKQAESMGQTLPLARGALDSYRTAQDAGLGRFDGSSLTRHLLGKR